ncbi:hypothetical protein P2318_19395 [Myxococcaceae bacterium GXIMD 01537]
MRRLIAVLLACALCACARPKPAASTESPPDGGSGFEPATGLAGCTLYTAPREVGRTPEVLAELSGLAASARHPGIFWAHNDSGNDFEVFAIEANGVVRARVKLTGASPRDVEDIAVAPCGAGDARPCLWLADTGDNFEFRKEVRLYRLVEPEQIADATLPVEALPFTYPDGAHDVEALVVDRTGRPAVLTKTRGSLGQLFALDGLQPGTVGKATLLGVLRAPGDVDQTTTAADLHPSGERLLVRTYTRVWEVRQPGAQRLEDLVRGTVVRVPDASQAQSEAAAYFPEGRGYLLGSEFTGQPLYRTECR